MSLADIQVQAEVKKLNSENSCEVRQLRVYKSPEVVVVYHYSGFPLSQAAPCTDVGQYALQHEQFLQIMRQSPMLMGCSLATQTTVQQQSNASIPRIEPKFTKKKAKSFNKKNHLPSAPASNFSIGNHSKEKTALCKFRQDCDSADCNFAHSEAELRPIFVKSTYKTAACQNTKCTYGFRCNRVHDNECIAPVSETCDACFTVSINNEIVLKFIRGNDDNDDSFDHMCFK